jgi:hypothetical protein
MRRQENTRPQHPKSVDVQMCPTIWQSRFGTVQVLLLINKRILNDNPRFI